MCGFVNTCFKLLLLYIYIGIVKSVSLIYWVNDLVFIIRVDFVFIGGVVFGD